MSFELTQSERDGVVLLASEGRLVIGPPVDQFRGTLESLLAAGKKLVVLDMRKVAYVDSTALGCLVTAHTRFERAGGRMTMFGLSLRNLELMVLTKLTTIFRIFDTEQDAVNACFPEREVAHFDILNFVQGQKKDS
jgi:anti-sigma B factor antagonist